MEKEVFAHSFLRCGLIIPVIAWTNTLGNIQGDIPWPKVGATVGAGYRFRNFTLDGALSGDHGKSYIEKKITLRGILSATLRFK